MQLDGWKLGVALAVCLFAAVAFFGLGYYAAVLTAGVDPAVAIQAATALGSSSPDVQDAATEARFALRRTAQSPAYGVQRLAGEGTARATSGLPDFLRTNPQVMGLLEAGNNSQTAMVRDYEKALDRFETKTLRDAGEALDGGAAAAGGAQDGKAAAAKAAEDDAGESVKVERRKVPSQDGVPGKAYALELGSFLSPERAEEFAGVLTAAGHAVAIAEQVDGAGRTWLHVRLGPYPTYAAAARTRQRLDAQGLTGEVVEEAGEEQQGRAAGAAGPGTVMG
jgi:hypothetical protein